MSNLSSEASVQQDKNKTYHVLYPFQLGGSQGGLFSAAQVTANAPDITPFRSLCFHAADTQNFTFEGRQVHGVNSTNLPFASWFDHDFLMQHLQAYTEMLPPYIAREVYRDGSIANPGSVEYLIKFFENHPVNFDKDEAHSARFSSVLEHLKPGDAVGIQGPVWFMPFIRDLSDSIRQRGVEHVQFEHQMIPERLDETPLGKRLIPCYQKADKIFFHTSVYADRLANMVNGPLPEMLTVDLGINQNWVDGCLAQVREFKDISNQELLTPRQQKLVEAVYLSRETIPHRFLCFDRMDPMKGTHTVIKAVQMFLDEARDQEGPEYQKKYQFAAIHELFDINNYRETSPTDQYLRYCKEMYRQLEQEHSGVVFVSESFTSAHGHRDALPSLVQGRTVLALHGQDGLGLSALEAAYINRDRATGLIIGDQCGSFLEAQKRGYDNLVHGVTAGDPVALKDAMWEVVRLQERAPDILLKNNAIFASKYVIPRKGTMLLS